MAYTRYSYAEQNRTSLFAWINSQNLQHIKRSRVKMFHMYP